jgi:YidC/Oxa1 family membrane protein insertase
VNPWHWLLDTLRWALTEFHDLFVPFFGEHSWGWAIIALTLVIRVLLLPLAAKQFKSMRGMQALNPEMQRIRKKYKVDRDLMKKDPQKYKEKRAKMNEEVMQLYQEHGVNPAASCLPLLLQAPIFFALFRILWAEGQRIDALVEAPFYVFSPLGQTANASVWGWILVILMAATMFLTQKQMMARNPASEGMQATQQKVMLYGMPVFLTFIAQGLPKGVLVYWVTTNLWQVGQQTFILWEVRREEEAKEKGDGKASSGKRATRNPSPPKGSKGKGASSGQRPTGPKKKKKKGSGEGRPSGSKGPGSKPGSGQRKQRDDHLPRRRKDDRN